MALSDGPTADEVQPPSDSARGAIAVGVAVALLFFGGLGTWAVTAPLNGAVIGNAVVKVDGNRKSVQHLDGGIVTAIHVQDGDHVTEGQVLVELDDTDARAAMQLLTEQYVLTTALVARLEAERDGSTDIAFPRDLTERSDDPSVKAAIDGQTSEFNNRRAVLQGRTAVLQARIEQLREEITGAEARQASYQDQLDSVVGERASLQGLVDKELMTRTRTLQLARTESGIRGQIADTDTAIAKAHLAIGEVVDQIAQLRKDQATEVAGLLRDARTKLADVAPRLDAARAALARTTIRAPYSGTVVGLDVFSVGGVIGRGDRVLDIVPDETPLLVEAEIAVEDIAQLRTGMAAEIRFAAHKQTVAPLLHGTVTDISADRLVDAHSGRPFYKAAVTVDPIEFGANPAIDLYPGMPATVMVTTEERTAFQYLVGPLFASFDHAFRQN